MIDKKKEALREFLEFVKNNKFELNEEGYIKLAEARAFGEYYDDWMKND